MENVIKKLEKEFNKRVHDELGSGYHVAVLPNSNANESEGGSDLQKIYPFFCKTIPYSVDLQKCIEGTIDKLFQSSGNAEEDKKPGLLLGKIQSGKTRAFVGCIARAFDEKNVTACIILTKGTNALVNQTVSRMRHDFIACQRGTHPKRFKTVSIYDIMKKRNGLPSSLIEKELNIFVCKKEKNNMNALINVFSDSSLRDKNILIIDDEADFVSRSFQRRNREIYEGMIGSQIDELMRVLPNARYLQVTATPYSLYLQPNEYVDVENGKVMPFRPRFTSLVPINIEYVGSTQYFGDLSENLESMYSCLHYSVDPECIKRLCADKKNGNGNRYKLGTILKNVVTTPKMADLRWSLMHYISASAIRMLQENVEYHTSYIMHVGIDTDDHEWECTLVEELLSQWSDLVKTNQTKDFDELFNNVYSNLAKSISLGQNELDCNLVPNIPKKEEVLSKIKDLLLNDEYHVEQVNSDNDVESLLDDSGQLELTLPLNIFIGGFVLDRGITINNLLGFFYGREPQTKQQATMLQHCRMYGYRKPADMAVTRLYVTDTLYDVMKQVNRMDDLMREKFEQTINDPNVDPSIEFIHCDKANGIIPCNPSSVALSSLVYWKPLSYVLPSGMMIENSQKVEKARNAIAEIIGNNEEKKCFEISKENAICALKHAQSQFVFSREAENLEQKGKITEMIGLINKIVDDGDTILAYTRKKCDAGRCRADGKGWINAPLDGNTESPYIQSMAKTKPVLMLMEQKGNKNKGWTGVAFYWPLICLPANITTIVYSPK